jgi:phosphoglycolate phosphatase-like HAD superfamily hydrolase
MGQKLKYNYCLFDKDDTILLDRFTTPYHGLAPGMKNLLKKIPKEKKAVITDNGLPTICFKTYGISDYFNENLFFSGEEETSKIINDPKHFIPKKYLKGKKINFTGNNLLDEGHITEYINKPSTYLIDKFLEKTKTNPSKCVMIGNSWEDILAGQKAGMDTIYIKGTENDKEKSVQSLKIKPTYTIPVGDTKSLEKILFEYQ